MRADHQPPPAVRGLERDRSFLLSVAVRLKSPGFQFVDQDLPLPLGFLDIGSRRRGRLGCQGAPARCEKEHGLANVPIHLRAETIIFLGTLQTLFTGA